MQTLCAGCSKAQPKISPRHRPLPGGAAKISSAGDSHYRYLQTQFGEDQCTQFRVIVVTDPQTNKQTVTGDCNTLRCSFASVQCNKVWKCTMMDVKGSRQKERPMRDEK